MSVTISIIVPVYNTEKYLNKCIESVVDQNANDWELILIDDGSKDDSLKVCKSYAEKYPQIRVVTKPNGGVSSARNVGISCAEGMYLLFLDSDDYLQSGILSRLLGTVEQQPDMVVFGQRMIKDEICVSEQQPDAYSGKASPDLLFGLLYKNLFGFCTNKLIRKDPILKHHISFCEQLAFREDHKFIEDLWPYLASVECVPDLFYMYVQRNSSAVNRINKKEMGNLPLFFPSVSSNAGEVISFMTEYNCTEEQTAEFAYHFASAYSGEILIALAALSAKDFDEMYGLYKQSGLFHYFEDGYARFCRRSKTDYLLHFFNHTGKSIKMGILYAIKIYKREKKR